ncbi:MAG: NAD(P)/FAD-dependent oxidoreductase, partial [Planctomycetota bacterium]
MSEPTSTNRRELVGAAAIATGVAVSEGTLEGENDAQDRPDVIFIGAGISSLSAALILAEAGWRVLVLDRNDASGGAVRTLELTLPGFRHDLGPMNLTVFANSSFFKDRQDRFARYGVEFITADRTFGSIADDGRFLEMSTDLDANLRSIGKFSSADVDAWKQWRSDFDRCAPTLFQILASPAATSGALDYRFGRSNSAPKDAEPTLRAILLDSLRGHLTQRFQSDVLQALIAAWGLHLDYAPDIAGGCWMPFLETNADERLGISIVKGGSG